MGATVLVIDDHDDILRLIRMALEFTRYQLLEAHTVAEGLSMARRFKPDLLLIEASMQDSQGLYVLDTVRTDPVLGAIPVIRLRGDAPASAPNTDGPVKNRGFDCLMKPFNPLDLQRAMDKIMAKAVVER